MDFISYQYVLHPVMANSIFLPTYVVHTSIVSNQVTHIQMVLFNFIFTVSDGMKSFIIFRREYCRKKISLIN